LPSCLAAHPGRHLRLGCVRLRPAALFMPLRAAECNFAAGPFLPSIPDILQCVQLMDTPIFVGTRHSRRVR
jgi:hypothetical protein